MALPGTNIARLLTAIALLALPFAVCAFSPLASAIGWLYSGALPVLVAVTVRSGAAAATAFVAAAGALVGMLVSGHSAWIVLTMSAVAAAVGYSSRWGLSAIGCTVAVFVANYAVSPTASAAAQGLFGRIDSVTAAMVVAAFVIAGGLWTAWVASLGLVPVPSRPVPHVDHRGASLYAGQLVVLVSLGTWVVIGPFHGPRAWWLLLTFFVVLMPTSESTRPRIEQRVVGTICGGLIAALVIGLVGVPVLVRALGMIAVLVTVLSFLMPRYWLFSAALTVAVVLTSYSDRVSGLLLTAERIGLTVLGGLAAAAVVYATEPLLLKHRVET